MKSRLIMNPVAGVDAAPSYVQVINERLRQDFGEVDISLTTGAGDAREIAHKTALDNDYTHIFIAGGDGTLNEVLNGVASAKGGLERIVLGLIPLGTGNDFANALGLTENVEETLQILAQKKVAAIDVGKINDQYFINVSAGGFIAEVSDAVNPELKSIAGKLAYLIGGTQVFFNYEPARALVKLELENESVERAYDLEMFAVCNSRLIGGGRMIAPDAVIDDGLFDVCIFKAMETFQFINLLAEISSGAHIENENVEYFRASAAEFKFNREIKVNADGEVFTVQSCNYKILPRAAHILAV